MKMFLVGGAVRDELLGVKSKDLDFAVEAESFGAMRDELLARGFMIFLENPEFLTIRARFPKGHEHARQTADFVLARKESSYTDGRRPDLVEPGTLLDDLSRRDFTCNAIAKDESGRIIDPFNGRADIKLECIRAVGNAEDRIREDALRGLRAIRFSVTKGFWIDEAISEFLLTKEFHELLSTVSTERIREEMHKAFAKDTDKTLMILEGHGLIRAVFSNGLWLKPTMEKP